MVIFLDEFWKFYGLIRAHCKNGEKTILPYAVKFRICCLITKHTGPFLSRINTGNHTITMLIFSVYTDTKPGPEVIKLFHAQLSMKVQLLIKTDIPTKKFLALKLHTL